MAFWGCGDNGRYIIEIPVTCLWYVSSVAGGGLEMAPVAHVRLLLDSVPGGQNQQAFCQGPSGDSVSFAGHSVSIPQLSSGHALWQRSEQQVTWGHQTSQGWCCAVPPAARAPDKRRPGACHGCRRMQPSNQSSQGGRVHHHLPSCVPWCLPWASLQRCVCCWSLGCGEPCTAPRPPAWQGRFPSSNQAPGPLPRDFLGRRVSVLTVNPGVGPCYWSLAQPESQANAPRGPEPGQADERTCGRLP